MSSSVPLLCSGSCDFPPAPTVRFRGDLFVSVRDFDKEADDHEDQYRLFFMPPLTDEETRSSWLRVEDRATRFVGKIAVEGARFDATHRKDSDTAVLRALLAPREVALR